IPLKGGRRSRQRGKNHRRRQGRRAAEDGHPLSLLPFVGVVDALGRTCPHDPKDSANLSGRASSPPFCAGWPFFIGSRMTRRFEIGPGWNRAPEGSKPEDSGWAGIVVPDGRAAFGAGFRRRGAAPMRVLRTVAESRRTRYHENGLKWPFFSAIRPQGAVSSHGTETGKYPREEESGRGCPFGRHRADRHRGFHAPLQRVSMVGSDPRGGA